MQMSRATKVKVTFHLQQLQIQLKSQKYFEAPSINLYAVLITMDLCGQNFKDPGTLLPIRHNLSLTASPFRHLVNF